MKRFGEIGYDKIENPNPFYRYNLLKIITITQEMRKTFREKNVFPSLFPSLTALVVCAVFLFSPGLGLSSSGVEAHLLESLRAAKDWETVSRVIDRVNEALREGAFFGREREVAEAVLPFMKDPSAPPDVLYRIQETCGIVTPVLASMDPDAAEEILVRVPLGWLSSGNAEKRSLALEFLRWSMESNERNGAIVARALPPALGVFASSSSEELEEILRFLEQVKYSGSFSAPYPQEFRERLLTYRGPLAWDLPDILALDPTRGGTESLLALARDPSRSRERMRALQLLRERSLTERQKRLIVEMVLDPSVQNEVLRLVGDWVKRGEPLPQVSPSLVAALEKLAVSPEACVPAVFLLARGGPSGLSLLFQMVRAEKENLRTLPCEWDRWSQVWEGAEKLVPELEREFREKPSWWVVKLLARAGRWDLVVEGLKVPDSKVRRAAAGILGLVVAPEEGLDGGLGDLEMAKSLVENVSRSPGLRERLRRALKDALSDEDILVRREARRALLSSGEKAAWAEVAALLKKPGGEKLRVLEELSGMALQIPKDEAFLLLSIAKKDSERKARILAVNVLGRAKLAPWRREVEGEIRNLLRDTDEEVRRAAAGYFVSVSAREEDAVKALIEATKDPGVYVRDAAAMALSTAEAWNPGLVDALKKRMEMGDSDSNVEGKLEEAYLNALRKDPGSVDRLLAVVLGKEGPARWRKALAEGPPASPAVSRALLKKLGELPLNSWAEVPGGNFGNFVKWIEAIARAEENPSPLSQILNLVPREELDPWLVNRALGDRKTGLKKRLWLIGLVQEIPEERKEEVWNLVKESLQEGTGEGEILNLSGRWGYEGIRRLIQELWDDPGRLRKVWRFLRGMGERKKASLSGAGGSLPTPGVEDLPWIEETLSRIPAGARDPRLEPVVDLTGIYEIGNNPELEREAFQTKIPSLLLRHLNDPEECRAVQFALGSLFHRTPHCGD
ncbi:MAG: HEAT repeat domain-containing protein [Deltaproteobacteria bacterium]|nr:MAG: HEAT repeat domain-containing protein [Deltaproteobacteria bacterium]